MKQPQLKPFEIFRAGTHTPLGGRALEFSVDDVKGMVDAYDPQLFRAPIVIGHPKVEDAAFGWVDDLSVTAAGTVEASPVEIEPQFAAMVQAGRFRKVSASLFTPAHPANPSPGRYYLKHVGFLGAVAPAVTGLKPVQFAEDGDEMTIEFAMSDATWSVARAFRNIREWMIAKFDMATADQVVPDYLVSNMDAAALDAADATANPVYSATEDEDMNTAEIAAREKAVAEKEAALTAKEAEFAARDEAIAKEEQKARRADIAEFAAGLVKSGRVLPRDQAALIEFMAGMNDETVIEFAEGEEKKKLAGDKWLRDFLSKLPPQVDFSEHAGAENDGGNVAVNFAAPNGFTVDAQRMELHRKALAHAKQHNVSYEQALAAIK